MSQSPGSSAKYRFNIPELLSRDSNQDLYEQCSHTCGIIIFVTENPHNTFYYISIFLSVADISFRIFSLPEITKIRDKMSATNANILIKRWRRKYFLDNNYDILIILVYEYIYIYILETRPN